MAITNKKKKAGKKYDLENDHNARRIHELHTKKVEQMEQEKQRRRMATEVVQNFGPINLYYILYFSLFLCMNVCM